MKKKIVFASTNQGKIRELQHFLEPLHIEIIPQSLLGIEEAEETALTFVENALLKARHAAAVSGKPAMADDSGLVVPALDGQPGIYSARFAGKHAGSEANIKKLLAEMQHFSGEERRAHFHCCLVYLEHAEDPAPIICEGQWEGEILLSTQGEKGFGYDPVFFDKEEGCSAAELELSRKNKISHRGKALQEMLQRLTLKSI